MQARTRLVALIVLSGAALSACGLAETAATGAATGASAADAEATGE